jgi:hypothetical protein
MDETIGLDTNENSEPPAATDRRAWQAPQLSRLPTASTANNPSGIFSDTYGFAFTS